MASFGYEYGSCGYNTLSYIIITPNNGSNINYKITIDNETSFKYETNVKTTIDQISSEPYPNFSIIINKQKIHSKKYYYTNVLVEITGDYTIDKKTRIDVDR